MVGDRFHILLPSGKREAGDSNYYPNFSDSRTAGSDCSHSQFEYSKTVPNQVVFCGFRTSLSAVQQKMLYVRTLNSVVKKVNDKPFSLFLVMVWPIYK